VVPLTADCTVGRGAAAALRLSDPSASRLHLRLRVDAAGTSAEDLGSRNGLSVNGGRARGLRRLRSGDELEAGETLLRFVDPLEPGELAGPSGPDERGGPAELGGDRSRDQSATWLLATAAALLLAAALTLLQP
jgi:pSer/pThr/pTyr-binding forkhead associated (FHA) protein